MVLLQLKGEERVRESGAPYTIVRPGRFVNKAEGAPVKLRIDQGDKINGSISPRDVAAICVSALRNPITVGVTFEVGRPARLAQQDIMWCTCDWCPLVSMEISY